MLVKFIFVLLVKVYAQSPRPKSEINKVTRPSILCVTHQMSRKKRDYSVD